MPDSIESPRGYRPDIDGLRAFAILLVIGYHYFGLPGGYVGVDVFFVISGYLITGILLSDLQDGRLSLSEFYARRFRRILPPLLVVIAASMVVGWVCLMPDDFKELSEEARAGSVYLANFLFWHESGYFDVGATTKPLLHLWSLAIEEQFYLLWPAFLLLANLFRRRVELGILAILVASFLVNVVTIHDDQAAAFYSPLSRLWELAAGGLLVHFERMRNGTRSETCGTINKSNVLSNGASILGFVLVLSAAALYHSQLRYPGYLAVVPVLGSALVLTGGADGWLNRTLLSWQPMVHIGKRSYSLYLWHWPVLVLALLIVADLHFEYLKEACLVISCLLAWGTYRWCETPVRRISIDGGNAWKFLAVGVGSSVAIASVASPLVSGSLSRASDSRLITRKLQIPVDSCTFSGSAAAKADTRVFAPCEVIRYPGRPVVVLVGDSHSASLYPGLKPYLDARQVNLIRYSAIGCGPPLLTRGVSPACAATYQYVLERVERDPPDLVILSAYYLTWNRLDVGYDQGIVQQMAQLRRAGSPKVLIVGQMPIWGETLPRILNQKYLRLGHPAPTRMFTGLDPESLQIDETMRSASEKLGLSYYSVKDKLCDPQGCLTRVGERLPDDLIVFDDGHATVSGARYLVASGLGQEIDALLAGKQRP